MTAERQRRYMQRLKAAAARASQATIDDREVTALRQDLARANARIAELERTKPKTEKAAPTPDEARDRLIKSLKTRVQNLQVTLHIRKEHYDNEIRKHGGMTFDAMRAIVKALQPDATEAERHAGLQAFNLFRSDERKARRR